MAEPLEYPLRLRCSSAEKANLVAVIGPPRIGSTLAYTLLASAYDLHYISNFEYLFYRTPLLAGIMRRRLFRRYAGGYRSYYGHVPGLTGPAEANLFWKHWFGYGLDEGVGAVPLGRRTYRDWALWRLCRGRRSTMLAGWIAHALYIPQVMQEFGNCLFVNIVRDQIDTAVSIYIGRERYRRDLQRWFSIRPRETFGMGDATPVEQIAAQVFFIRTRIEEARARGTMALMDAAYADVCSAPHNFVARVAAEARATGIALDEPALDMIPLSFPYSTYQGPEYEELAQQFRQAFARLRAQSG
jgi:hypothetical protein